MNETANKFLLTGNNFMPEFHLRQPGLKYNTCGPFTKHLERIQKFKETGDLNFICKHELDKTCFAHDSMYFNSNDLAKRTISDKVLKNRASEIALNPEYGGYQRRLASMVYKLFD